MSVCRVSPCSRWASTSDWWPTPAPSGWASTSSRHAAAAARNHLHPCRCSLCCSSRCPRTCRHTWHCHSTTHHGLHFVSTCYSCTSSVHPRAELCRLCGACGCRLCGSGAATCSGDAGACQRPCHCSVIVELVPTLACAPPTLFTYPFDMHPPGSQLPPPWAHPSS